jgi:flagellar motor switch protein FliN
VVLGQEVEISPPDIRILEQPGSGAEFYGTSPHATSTTFLIEGEACRLIQLVPSAFVVRICRAFDELNAEPEPGDADAHAALGYNGADGQGPASMGLVDALGEIKLRVWAELGRTRLPLGRALGLPLGAVVELDRAADAPVDLFVNGVRFAQGHLLTTDDGEWALALDEVGGRMLPEESDSPAQTSTTPETQGAAI